jgi:xanthine/uracil permease
MKIDFERRRWKFLSTPPVLIAIIAGYILSTALSIIDCYAIKEASVFGLPGFLYAVLKERHYSIKS